MPSARSASSRARSRSARSATVSCTSATYADRPDLCRLDTDAAFVNGRLYRSVSSVNSGVVPTVRQRVLDAAREIVIAGDWGRTRMGDVASRAGVSRQTLYNEFGSKDGLAQALSLAEADWFLARTQEQLAEHPDDPVAGIRAAVRFTLDAGADDPLL